MELKIERLANNGKGIGKAPDGKTVFVSGAVPGDLLRVAVSADRSRFYEAEIRGIIEPSADRIPSDCPEQEHCGGCCFRQMTYEAELEAKTGFVRDAFRRIGGFDELPMEPILPSPLTEAYRNKAEFAIGADAEGKLFSGFYSEKTHRVVPVPNCRIVPEDFLKISECFVNVLNLKENLLFRNKALEYSFSVPAPRHQQSCTRAASSGSKLLDCSRMIRHLVLRRSGLTGEIMLIIVFASEGFPGDKEAAEKVRELFPAVTSVILNVNPNIKGPVLGSRNRVLSGADFIRDQINAHVDSSDVAAKPTQQNCTHAASLCSEQIWDQICGVPVEVGPLSFFQVNTPAAEALYRTAAEFAQVRPEDVVLDLYCGMGTIGLSMAANCRQLIGGEIIPEAVDSAKRNAAAMGLENTRFFCGDAAEIAETLIRENIHPTLIILDPPRKGCSPETLNAVKILDPDRIVMVSCDPATAARDCRTLSAAGYHPSRLRPADLFPRTRHVETCVLLSKLKTVPYIDVHLDMDELDLTAAESKASYQKIRDYIHKKYGFNIPNLYIAQVKRKLGLEVGVNYNLSKKNNHHVPQCPPEKEAAIIDALKHFQMLK